MYYIIRYGFCVIILFMKTNNLELYIHIPFCDKKCNYCDFLSFEKKDDLNIKLYIEKIIQEITAKKNMAKNYIISSIYIGGGTPSSINANYIYEILKNIYNNYNINENAEISIEANPHSITLDKMKIYKEASINRVSIGVQSTDNNELKTLGRLHTYEDFIKSYDAVIHAGFNNINFDVINGIPHQTEASFRNTLKNLIKLMPKHLSIYNLIIEENTPFYDLNINNKLYFPDEDEMIKIDNVTDEITSHFHFDRYEISNYAKKGFECIHNLGYWSDVPYLGFGLGAASYFEGFRYKNFSDMQKYLNTFYDMYDETINKYIYYDEANLILKKDSMAEFIYLGMRKINGISRNDFFDKFSENIEDIYKYQLDKYIKEGLIIFENDRYFLSKRGLDVSNQIFASFVNI